MRIKALVIALATGLSACASLSDENKLDFTLSGDAKPEVRPIPYTGFEGLADYDYKDQRFKAEWINCRVEQPRATILLMHGDRAGYDRQRFCDGWVAQTFLSEKIEVIAVNRPGFARSSGRADFAGPQSTAAVNAGLTEALKTGKNPRPVTLIWGYSSGATAATHFSKNWKGIQHLILGGGIYDLEDALAKSNDQYLKNELEALKAQEGSEGLESRSIAFDVSNLPPRVTIYHGLQDQAIPPRQASAFRDTLISSEYKVNLQLIEGLTHDIPWASHRKILQVLSQTLSQEKPKT